MVMAPVLYVKIIFEKDTVNIVNKINHWKGFHAGNVYDIKNTMNNCKFKIISN